jgi:predicted MPP superfamily phosphohydrolase
MLASAFIEISIGLFLFLAVCLGHAALWICHHNWWYAFPFRKDWPSDVVHLIHAVILLGFPTWLVFEYGIEVQRWAFDFGTPGRAILFGYLCLCWFMALVLFPLETILRRRRRFPAVLAANHTVTRDFARELGYRPVGSARFLRLASLPRNEIFQVDFSEKTLRVAGLPAEWDGLSILHLSDLHFIGVPDRIFHLRVMETCAAWEPDILALTGDIVDTHQHRRWILPVLGRLRWKIAAFAILGNHDLHWEPELVRRRLRRLDMHVLGNGWKTIEVRGVPMALIGNEEPWFRPGPDLADCPPGIFRVCLSHTPDNIAWARRNQVRLMLSGHNHGGQIRLPGIGSVFVPSRYSRRYDCGTFDEPPTLLHVCRGLASQHPVRYNCRPEIVKLILRSAPNGTPQGPG